MKVTIDIREKKSAPPPSGDLYGVAKLNYEMCGVSRPTLNRHPQRDGENPFGLPDTIPFKNYSTIKLTQDLSWWIHEMCCFMAGMNPNSAEAKLSWFGLMRHDRYITNKAGTGMPDPTGGCMYRDWINSTDMDKPDMQMMTLATGGAYFRLIGEAVFYRERIPHWKIQTIDSRSGYRNFNPKDHPYLFDRPTISVREQIFRNGRWTGKYIENISTPFPFYRQMAHVPYLTSDGNFDYVPKDRIRILVPGQSIPSRFVR